MRTDCFFWWKTEVFKLLLLFSDKRFFLNSPFSKNLLNKKVSSFSHYSLNMFISAFNISNFPNELLRDKIVFPVKQPLWGSHNNSKMCNTTTTNFSMRTSIFPVKWSSWRSHCETRYSLLCNNFIGMVSKRFFLLKNIAIVEFERKKTKKKLEFSCNE